MKRIFLYLFLIIAGVILLLPFARVHGENDGVDVHMHLDPGMSRNGSRTQQSRDSGPMDTEAMTRNIVSSMDKMGVEKGIIMPPPMIPSQQGIEKAYAICLSAVAHNPTRLLLGGGGNILNPLIYEYEKNEVTQEVQKQFRDEAEKLIKAGIVVFGEMSALHLSLHDKHIFSQVDPDHPLFLLLADIAAENDIPIDLHMEAVPKDIPTPESILETSSLNPNTLKANIGGLERLLEHNRKAKIVWQHIGWDNIGYMTIELLADLLKKHSNLYLALRVERRRMQMDRSTPMPNRIVDEDGKIYPEWTKFITEFSDRIVIGSDEFMGMTRLQPRGNDSFKETWGIVKQFPEEIARKIGHDNARRIYNIR